MWALVATHDDYVRADVKVELSGDKPRVDVEVKLTKAARIDVTVVDSKGGDVLHPGRTRRELYD